MWRLTCGRRRRPVLAERQQELRPHQLLIGCRGGGPRRLDDLIGGGGAGGRDGDLAELPGEVSGAEAAVHLQADAAVLTEQRAEDCGGDGPGSAQFGSFWVGTSSRTAEERLSDHSEN